MKRLLIVLGLVTLLILATGVYFFFNNPENPLSGNQPPTPQDGVLPESHPFSLSPPIEELRREENIIIGTETRSVITKNFYRNAYEVEGGGVYVLLSQKSAEIPDYEVSYDRNDTSFYIHIADEKFSSLRSAAEENFVTLLSISRKDACKLNVRVEPWSGYLNGQRVVERLRFCITAF